MRKSGPLSALTASKWLGAALVLLAVFGLGRRILQYSSRASRSIGPAVSQRASFARQRVFELLRLPDSLTQ
jgi:hypothetical protein